MQEELALAIEAARVGGNVLREGIGKIRDVLTVGYKGEVDLVTEYDKLSEKLIVETILHTYPHHQILAEEGTVGGSDPAHRWIIDPLDGTTNFAHAYPISCVSVAYEYQGELVAGVVNDPFRGELFSAAKGNGAYLNGERIHVSTTPDLKHSLVATGFPYSRDTLTQVLHEFGELVWRTQAVRRDGAAALDLAYVAAGRFDAFWERTLNAWDAAAGVLLIREAGGLVTTFANKPWTVDNRDIVTANLPAVLNEIIAVLGN